LALIGASFVGPSQSSSNPMNVCIDREDAASEGIHHHALGNFSGNAGKSNKIPFDFQLRPFPQYLPKIAAAEIPDDSRNRSPELFRLDVG
jgi:hypothetical protein